MLKFSQFWSFKEHQKKSAFLKLVAQEFETGDFLNILEFLRFIFSLKKASNSCDSLGFMTAMQIIEAKLFSSIMSQ